MSISLRIQIRFRFEALTLYLRVMPPTIRESDELLQVIRSCQLQRVGLLTL